MAVALIATFLKGKLVVNLTVSPIKRPSIKENTSPGEETIVSLLRYSRVGTNFAFAGMFVRWCAHNQ